MAERLFVLTRARRAGAIYQRWVTAESEAFSAVGETRHAPMAGLQCRDSG
jgi:hypothetical protein